MLQHKMLDTIQIKCDFHKNALKAGSCHTEHIIWAENFRYDLTNFYPFLDFYRNSHYLSHRSFFHGSEISVEAANSICVS